MSQVTKGAERQDGSEASVPARSARKPIELAPPVGGFVRQHDIDALRSAIRAFEGYYDKLPVVIQATCPKCQKVVEAEFSQLGRQIVLTYRCPDCGASQEVHADAIWSHVSSEFSESHHRTETGAQIQPVLRRLPRTVETLCPECGAVILGRYFVGPVAAEASGHDDKATAEGGCATKEEHGRDARDTHGRDAHATTTAEGGCATKTATKGSGKAVYIEKTCPQHGYFKDCVSSDALLYSKAAWWSFDEHGGQKCPQRSGKRCPSDCGLCGQHQSASCLAQIDMTNRCNMRCPVCFANANAAGYVCEPSYEQILTQLKALREMSPYPATAVQFTGGEPTLHPDFFKILSATREMGFSHIQMATNGIRLADEAFARQAAQAGLHTLYLQFDGVGEEAYRYTRAYPGIWEKKLACIENCRKLDLKICLVPTIVRGVNDEQVGEIFRFAVANADVISAISYQPVSFTGRMEPGELEARRYTLGHLAHDIADASGAVPLRDMFPLSIVMPLAQFLQAVTGQPKIRPSCHPDCAFGTYFLISPEGKPFAFPQVIDVEGMFSEMNTMSKRLEAKAGRLSWLDKMAIFRMFRRHFRTESAPPGLDVKRFIRSLQGLLDKNAGRGDNEKATYKTLLCAGMHFMDRYNYDVQRVKRCVILYSTPEGIFPFCTYNCGPEYRSCVEHKHRRVGTPAGETQESTS